MVSKAMQALQCPDIDTVWEWLDAIPDPEIPAVSLVEMGIVRDAQWDCDLLRVVLTPTYSGCPATSVIRLDVENTLRERGIEHIEIKTRLRPAWTTDWISEAGRQKLRAYGIAPPAGAASCAGMMAVGSIDCPRCGSCEVERISEFGSTPCKAHYRCTACLEPFDYFKPI